MTHNYRECERCQIDLVLYGESVYNSTTGEHQPVEQLVTVRADVDTWPPRLREAIVARFDP